MPHSPVTSTAAALKQAFLVDLADPAQFTQMFAHLAGMSFFAKNQHYQLMLGNSHFYRRFGFTEESEVIGKTDFDLFPRPLAETFRRDDEQVMSTGKPVLDIIELFLNQQGMPDWFITQKIPLMNKQGKPCGVMGVIQAYDHHQNIIAADPAIAEAANQLRNDPGKRWRMDDVAASVHLSQRQFDRKFKVCFGVTPQNYLVKTRIQAACEALRRPGALITQVAIDLGFYDQSAFTVQFRRHMGITPLHYQRQYRDG